MNIRVSNNNIPDRGQIGSGGWWGREQKVLSRSARNTMMQQIHQLITNGRSRSHLHHRLALCMTGLLFASQACYLHHRIDRARPRKEWVDMRASCFARSRLHHRRYKLLRSSLALRL